MKDKLKELLPYIIIIIVVVLFRTYIATPVQVVGDSMYDTLKDKEVLILNKITYRFSDIKRFDIVVIKEDSKIIKRIIGLPGENIEYKDNKLYVNDKLVQDNHGNSETKNFTLKDICSTCDVIPDGYYLVLGDNRRISKDSRSYGLIKQDLILGKTSFRIWPLGKFGKING